MQQINKDNTFLNVIINGFSMIPNYLLNYNITTYSLQIAFVLIFAERNVNSLEKCAN